MTRLALISAAVLAALASPATAQPGGFRIVDVQVADGKLTWTEAVPVQVEKAVPVVKEVTVEKELNGKKVVVVEKVTVNEKVVVTEFVSVKRTTELKTVAVTDGAGKAVAADKVAERLGGAPAVLLTGPLPAKHRALFKADTLFIEPAEPKGNK